MGAVDEILEELKMIPREITTTINVKKLTDEVSKELQKRGNRGFSQ